MCIRDRSKAALDLAADAWKRAPGKRVAYLSAEFLVGRLVYANLLNMGRLGAVQQMLLDAGVDANVFEEIEDAALGNGGLGRLAAVSYTHLDVYKRQTLYVGRRKNALDHIEAAYENGFSPFSTGCQIIIADGLKGTDEVDVPCLLYTSRCV